MNLVVFTSMSSKINCVKSFELDKKIEIRAFH